MQIVQQFFLGSLFLIISALCFLFPWLYFSKRLKLDVDNLEKIVLLGTFGIVLFTLSAYFLAFLHLRFLMYVFPFLGILFLLKQRGTLKFHLAVKYKKFFILILLIGIIGQVLINAPSGFPYQDGIYFYSSHGHDGAWHLALMEEMHRNNFPFQNPEYKGEKLQNYHFFVDLLMSEFSRMFLFSNLDIYFRFMPVIFSLLLGLSSFILVRAWGKNELAGIWAMIFTYFAGSFGYLLYVPTHKALGGESIFWVSQTQSVLGNPPHAAAFVIATTFLFSFLKYLKTRKSLYFILCVIFAGAVIEFKVYAGVLILGGLFITGFLEFLTKRIYKTLLLFFLSLTAALIIYLPNSANSQDFLIWQPWWYIRTMVVAPDRLNWIDLELKRQTYIYENNWKRVVQVETTAFLIFLFGNLGMRFLGFWTIFKHLKQNIFKNLFNFFFLTITTASFFIPVFFLQKGVAWNSIQFNQYFLLFFGFLAALSMPDILKLFKNRFTRVLVSLVIILLAVPTQIGLLRQFYSNLPLSKISYKELEALNFLKNQKDGLVLVAPFNKYEKDKYKNPPIPIYAWYDTGYVSAFSNKKTLISDEEQITIMGYEVDKLLQERAEAFDSSDYHKMNNFLEKNNIDYIYLAWNQRIATDSSFLNTDLIFQNKDATVLKVRK